MEFLLAGIFGIVVGAGLFNLFKQYHSGELAFIYSAVPSLILSTILFTQMVN